MVHHALVIESARDCIYSIEIRIYKFGFQTVCYINNYILTHKGVLDFILRVTHQHFEI